MLATLDAMMHLAAELPGLLEPTAVRRALAEVRLQVDKVESQSLRVVLSEEARDARREATGCMSRLTQLARAGYAPLASMPSGSYVAPDFASLGNQVNELLRRVRRVVDHCNQVEQMNRLRQQAEVERENRRRFPDEIALLDAQREILAVLYPDRWLLLYDGEIHGDFATAQEALTAGEEWRGRDADGRPLFLVFCHRTKPI